MQVDLTKTKLTCSKNLQTICNLHLPSCFKLPLTQEIIRLCGYHIPKNEDSSRAQGNPSHCLYINTSVYLTKICSTIGDLISVIENQHFCLAEICLKITDVDRHDCFKFDNIIKN